MGGRKGRVPGGSKQTEVTACFRIPSSGHAQRVGGRGRGGAAGPNRAEGNKRQREGRKGRPESHEHGKDKADEWCKVREEKGKREREKERK